MSRPHLSPVLGTKPPQAPGMGLEPMSGRQEAMKQIILSFPFLFCNLMPLPHWNTVDLWFCACHQCTAAFFSYDVYIQHICAFLDSFSIMVIAEGRGKFHLLNIRSLCSIYYRYRFRFICWTNRFLCMVVPTSSECILATFFF